MVWHFPLLNIRGLQYDYSFPRIKDDHPGAFGAIRKFDVHTGVDLYCKKRTPICAVEDGEVVPVHTLPTIHLPSSLTVLFSSFISKCLGASAEITSPK